MAVYTQALLSPDPLYLQTKSYDARSDRKWFADLLGAGVVGAGDFAVTATAGNMNISVAAGTAYILGQNVVDQGMYRQYSPTATVLTVPGNVSGNPRVETVIMRMMDNAADSSGFNEGRIEVVPGTPTAGATLVNLSGIANLTTLGEASKSLLLLGYVLVPNNATVLTTAGNVRDGRTRAGMGTGSIAGGTLIGQTIEWNAPTPPSGGLYMTEDGSAISRGVFAAAFGILGTVHGAGDGSTTFNIPDSRGRAAFGYAPSGGHADMSTVGLTDGLAVGVRRSLHKHQVAVNMTDPGHFHALSPGASGAVGGTVAGTTNSPSASGSTGTKVTGITFAPTVGPQTGNEPTDTPAYIVKHKLIRVA
jgi:microcystin-dependent protein